MMPDDDNPIHAEQDRIDLASIIQTETDGHRGWRFQKTVICDWDIWIEKLVRRWRKKYRGED